MSKKPKMFATLTDRYSKIAWQIDGYFDKWKSILGLQNWVFYVSYHPNLSSEDEFIRATINPQSEYRNARVDFYIPALANDDDEDIEKTVVHEFVHCLLQPMVTKKTRRTDLEGSTVDVTNALMKIDKISFKKSA